MTCWLSPSIRDFEAGWRSLSHFIIDGICPSSNEVRGLNMNFSSAPMTGIFFSSEMVLICLREF